MSDRIIYTVVTEPGGVDGLDHLDQGGQVTFATYNRGEAEKKIGADSRLKLVPIVLDDKQELQAILMSLDPVRRMILQSRLDSDRAPR